MTNLLTSVLAPTGTNEDDVETKFTAKVSNLVRLLGFTTNTVHVTHAKNILVRRYEMKYGRSNITKWRLCHLTMDEMLALTRLPRYSARSRSPFADRF